jgi:hypothetical protein
MVEYLYYIIENVITSDVYDKGSDTRILKIPTNKFVCKLKDGEGPYESLIKLKRYSKIFESCRGKGPKYLEKLLNENNIETVTDFVLIQKGRTYSRDFIKLLDHTIRGQIKKRHVYGVHYYEPDMVKIRNIVRSENRYGVWAAKIEVFDKKNNIWILKEMETTFFPRDWTLAQLFHECDHAFMNKRKDENREHVYIARTQSGVPVEIIVDNNIIRTIYPIFD